MSGASGRPAPLLGIALAAYEPDPAVFAEQLRSIRAQVFQDWVCVITLDPAPGAAISDPRVSEQLRDPRFVLLRNPARLGHLKNFEKAMREAAARGVKYLACSDQDDLWYPEKTQTCLDALERVGPLALVHSDLDLWVDGTLLPQTAWELERRGVANCSPFDLLIRNVVTGCTMMLDAELIRRFPVIPEAAGYHDHWYAVVASLHGGVHAIHHPLLKYRQHGGNVVGVARYHSYFYTPRRFSPRELLRKCAVGWEKSRALALAAEAAGLALPPELTRAFVNGEDLGARLLLRSARSRLGDPALSRASLVRGLGKLVTAAGLARASGSADTSRS